MRRIFSAPEDDFNESVKRYEAFLSNHDGTSGYFDVEELEDIVDYYLRSGRTKDSSGALEFGLKLHPNNFALRIKGPKFIWPPVIPTRHTASSNHWECKMITS